MQLEILPDSYVSDTTGMTLRNGSNSAELVSGKQTVGDGDANHEIRECVSDSPLAAKHSRAVTLGVDSPPSEICSNPFRRDGAKAFARETADFLQPQPRVPLTLEPVGFWRLRFCNCVDHKK